jgi:hypothetical protein
MNGAEALRESAMYLMIVPALTRRINQPRSEDDVLVAAAPVEIVMLEEHGSGKDNIGGAGRLSHELLVDADKEILAGKTPFHPVLFGRD